MSRNYSWDQAVPTRHHMEFRYPNGHIEQRFTPFSREFPDWGAVLKEVARSSQLQLAGGWTVGEAFPYAVSFARSVEALMQQGQRFDDAAIKVWATFPSGQRLQEQTSFARDVFYVLGLLWQYGPELKRCVGGPLGDHVMGNAGRARR